MGYKLTIKVSGILGMLLVSGQSYAVCPAAPVGAADDPVVQLRLNADATAGMGAANAIDSTEEGALVWNDAANAVAYCDGTNWVTLTASVGADNLGNHTATQNLALGSNDITGIGTATAGTFTATSANGLLWESGVNSLTHNDGGGNVQMRWGHDFTSSDERFTHGGGAVVMTSNIDATANTALTIKVSSNPGAGDDQPVTWGSSFVVTPGDVTFGGTSLLPVAGTLTNGNFCTTDGSVINCTTAESSIDAGTLDGIDGANFLRSNADDTTSGNIGFTAGHGQGLRFWNNDAYKIYMSQVSDGTWGGRLDATSDYNMYFRMSNGTNRGFVFRNGTTNVAQIDSTGNLYLEGHVFLPNKEPTDLTLDGEMAFDSSRGLILYRTQQVGDETGNGGYTVLDTSNIAAGAGIAITNTAANTAGTSAITIATSNVDAATVDGIDGASFIRSDANDDVSGHTEWQDNMDVRLGTDADFRMDFNGTNTIMRSYNHGAAFYLQGEDAAGTNRNILYGDPDGRTSLYFNGAESLRTQSGQVKIYNELELSGGNLELNSGDNGGNTNSGADMYMHNSGLIASEDALELHMDSSNNGTGALIVRKGASNTTSGNLVELFRVKNNGGVNLSNDTVQLNKGGNNGNAGVGPDIWFDNVALLAAEQNFRIHIDSDNNSTGAFVITQGSEVSSSGTRYFNISNGGNLTLDVGTASKTGGGSWSSTSDIRLKTVDGEYNKGLSDLIQLEPIMFHYTEDNARNMPSDKQEYGFVAQEVQKVFPEAVEEGEDGYLSLNLHTINVATINALKELKAENEELKKRLKALEEKLQ